MLANLAAIRPVKSAKAPFAWAAAAALACIFIGVVAPKLVGSELLMSLLTQAVINAVFALSVGTLLRLNGTVSFGHAAFYGLAVYIVGLGINRAGLPPELAILLALLGPTVAGFLIGLGIAGIPGVAFSMVTLAIGQGCYEFAMKARALTGGDDGFDIALPSRIFALPSALFQRPGSMFVICWIVLVLVVAALSLLGRSRFGRLAIAIRENEERARFLGYDTRMARAAALAISALIAALAGVLNSLYSAFASPDVLHWSVSGSALIMTIVGGSQLVWGPAFGAMLYFFFKDLAGDLTQHWQALVGLTLVVVTIFIPDGVAGTLVDVFVSRRRGRPS